MISVFQLFKIIFGLIVSGLILYFAAYYVSNYTLTQESIQKTKIIHNFIETAQDVYLTGNSINFTQFSYHGFSPMFDTNDPEGIYSTDTGKTEVRFPLFLASGEELFIEQNYMGIGDFSEHEEWWRFYFVIALPETTFVFNLIENDERVFEQISDIVNLLPYTPDPHVRFTFCDGDTLLSFNYCNNGYCNKYDFLEVLENTDSTFLRCSMNLHEDRYRLITVADACHSSFNNGICIQPPLDGVGNAYITGTPEPFRYKDPLDLIAIIIGGQGYDEQNRIIGKRYYEYKNRIFAERLGLAARLMAKRAFNLANVFPGCREEYIEMSLILHTGSNSLSSILDDRDYYLSDQANALCLYCID